MLTLKIITVVLSLLVTSIGLGAQVWKNSKRKSVEGLSVVYFLPLAVSYSFWSAYGFMQNVIVLIIPMCFGMIMSWIVVAQFALFRRK